MGQPFRPIQSKKGLDKTLCFWGGSVHRAWDTKSPWKDASAAAAAGYWSHKSAWASDKGEQSASILNKTYKIKKRLLESFIFSVALKHSYQIHTQSQLSLSLSLSLRHTHRDPRLSGHLHHFVLGTSWISVVLVTWSVKVLYLVILTNVFGFEHVFATYWKNIQKMWYNIDQTAKLVLAVNFLCCIKSSLFFLLTSLGHWNKDMDWLTLDFFNYF